MTFQLDTTGRVQMGAPDAPEDYHVWGDLDAFTQGYIEAMFAAMKLHPHSGEPMLPLPAASRDAGTHIVMGFSSLAPEALARIIADCEAIMAAKPALYDQVHDGKMVWQNRQAGFGGGFEPLNVQLSDDGKVRFA